MDKHQLLREVSERFESAPWPSEKPPTLTPSHVEELSALAHFNDALAGPASIHRSQWLETDYRSLVRRGLVIWGDAPEGFDKRRFAGVQITEAGRDAIASGTSGETAERRRERIAVTSTGPAMDKLELLPCPFCGGAATIEPKNWAGRDFIGVFCNDCLIFQDSRSATDAEAVAAWNTRILDGSFPDDGAVERAARVLFGEYYDLLSSESTEPLRRQLRPALLAALGGDK